MSDENVESHTLALLREIRDRLDRMKGTQQRQRWLAQHSQTLAEHGVLLDALVKAVTVIDADQQKQTEILKEHSKKLDGLTDLGRNHAPGKAIDGRFGLVEGRVGLVPV